MLLVHALRDLIALDEISDEQRHGIFFRLMQGYCKDCGRPTEWICHCENDE